MIRSRNAPAPAYEKDFVAWLEDQARRARRGEGLDLENVAEQLEGVARSDRREIRSRLSILLTHLLKCTAHPEKPSSSWLGTIADERDRIADLIEDSPSLRDLSGGNSRTLLSESTPRRSAPNAAALPESAFPEGCPLRDRRDTRPAGCPAEPKAEISKTNVVRFRLTEYKPL